MVEAMVVMVAAVDEVAIVANSSETVEAVGSKKTSECHCSELSVAIIKQRPGGQWTKKMERVVRRQRNLVRFMKLFS